jgi:hypothetical protein
LLIEYKWYESGNIPKDLFLDEFVNRDLNNITNLKNLQWRIKGQKLTKEKVMEYLSSAEGKKIVDNSKIRNLFENFGKIKGDKLKIIDTDDLIEFLHSNNDWFDTIFK